MSKGCIIISETQGIYRFHAPILSFGEPGFLGRDYFGIAPYYFFELHVFVTEVLKFGKFATKCSFQMPNGSTNSIRSKPRLFSGTWGETNTYDKVTAPKRTVIINIAGHTNSMSLHSSCNTKNNLKTTSTKTTGVSIAHLDKIYAHLDFSRHFLVYKPYIGNHLWPSNFHLPSVWCHISFAKRDKLLIISHCQ